MDTESLMEELFSLNQWHVNNKADKIPSAYSFDMIPARETVWYKKYTGKIVLTITIKLWKL